MTFQGLAELCFCEENGELYFMPYGIIGRKIKINAELKDEATSSIIHFYKLSIWSFVISYFLLGLLTVVVVLPITIFYYACSVRKIEQKTPPEFRCPDQFKPKTLREYLRSVGLPAGREDFKKMVAFSAKNRRSICFSNLLGLPGIIILFFCSTMMIVAPAFLIIRGIDLIFVIPSCLFFVGCFILNVFSLKAYLQEKKVKSRKEEMKP